MVVDYNKLVGNYEKKELLGICFYGIPQLINQLLSLLKKSNLFKLYLTKEWYFKNFKPFLS